MPVGPEITMPEGFEATPLSSPSDHGSWVSLTEDNNGRLLASDQYGRIYRINVENDQVLVDSIDLNIGNAQGMLWAHNSLYVTVNGNSENGMPGSGVYKLTDTNGDDELDQIEQLISLDGEGEHGPHGIILGPDGESMYMIAGNHTVVPKEFSSVLNHNWQEDRIFPSIVDPRGHANAIKPPGGWIARSNDRGMTWEVIASGFRNAYDIAFNQNGDLFTYDSDMEWDLGTPWYRPTRVCHVIPGAEFGWRTGSGKWPAYYADNLPPVLEVGQGSPTGVVFGFDAKFPEEYQHALFIADWSFGTIYTVELTTDGASYRGNKKEFLSGSPLAITDMVIGSDGNLYFTTGGRKGTSHLYRVKYVGNESTAPVSLKEQTNEDRQLVREILTENEDLTSIWQNLDHPDRFVRYSARVALERTPVSEWETTFSKASEAGKFIRAALAAIRAGMNPVTIREKLLSVDARNLPLELQLDFIRTVDVYIARIGRIGIDRAQLPAFPSENPALNRELAELLVFLDDEKVIEPVLALMEASEEESDGNLTPKEVLDRSEQYGPVIKAMHENRPSEQGIAMALALSHMDRGWNSELRQRYFEWFSRAFQKSGGMSYVGFLEKIRLQALSHVPADERRQLAELSGDAQLLPPLPDASVKPPQGPGKNRTINEALAVVDGQLQSKDLKRGEELYKALLCASCHRMDGNGGNVGPDLSQAGTRFSNYDLLMAMISPSISISDQYASTRYTLNDGSTLIGRPVSDSEETITVSINPYSDDVRTIQKRNIQSSGLSPVSPMPAGLINTLNDEELRELMAYLTKSRSSKTDN